MMKRGRIEFEDVAVEGADVGDLWGAGQRSKTAGKWEARSRCCLEKSDSGSDAWENRRAAYTTDEHSSIRRQSSPQPLWMRPPPSSDERTVGNVTEE